MPNMLDYVSSHQAVSFQDLPLNELDIACLNELGYLTYQEVLPENLDWQQFFNLSALIDKYADQVPSETNFLVTQERLALLQAVSTSSRFQDLEIGYYVNDISDEYEKQFAAMVMRIPSIGHVQVVFRGTDDTIVGWKEDFNMTYRSVIPAQFSAKQYLEKVLTAYDGQVVVSGHSKGGNLALYASSFVSSDLQDRITAIYVFDAPGLRRIHLNTPGYQTIKPRILAYRPYESVVGVMLPNDFTYQTVASQGFGLYQHLMEHWQVEDTAFSRLPQLSLFSLSLEKAIEDWRTSYSSQELKLIFDTFFDLFFDSQISSINDLMTNPGQGLRDLLTTYSHLEKDKRDFLEKAFFHLFVIYNKHSAEQAWNAGTENIQDFLTNLQGQFDSQEKDGSDRKFSLPDLFSKWQFKTGKVDDDEPEADQDKEATDEN